MLCKFYQKGYCKYGDSCRFVHENYEEEEEYYDNRSGYYGRGDDGYVNKKSQQHFSTRYDYNEQGDYRRQNSYKPRSNQHYTLDNRGTHNNRFEQFERNKAETNYEVDDEDEKNLELLQNDMKEWKNSNTMWQLSCYGPRIHSPNIPGFEEFSVEEVRFAYIKARNEGNLPQYHQWLNGIADTNHKMRKQFSYLTDHGRNYAMDLVRKLASETNDDGKQTTNNLFKSSSSHASPFSSGAFQNPPVEAHKKVFGAVNQQSGSIFQQQQQSANIFQQQPQQTANMLQQQPQQPANIFQQQPQQTAGIFQQQPTSFLQQQQQIPQQNPFQKTNVFQQHQHAVDVAKAFQTHQPQSSPFQQPPQQQQSTFQHQPQQQFNAFFNQPHGNRPFSSQPASNPPPVFGGGGGGVGFAATRSAAGDAFGGTSLAGRNGDFYTGMDCLIDDDLREFQSESFTFVPAVPPPKELV